MKALKTFAGVVAVYVIITGLVAWRNREAGKRAAVHYIASRALPPNHRLVEAELIVPPEIRRTPRESELPARSTLAGKYTPAAIGAKQPIVAAELLDEPRIEERVDHVIVPIAIPADLPPSAIDAGSLVDILSAGKVVMRRARVTAVRCSGATTCVVLMQLPSAIATSLGDKPTIVLRTGRGGADMQERDWKPIKTVDVPSRPADRAIWTRAVDYVPANTVLKLEAAGSWQYADHPPVTCGPDGDPASSVTAAVAVAPVGAVIGRIGGSTATKPVATDTSIFAVGSFAIVTSAAAGPLYLTINVDPAKLPAASQTIKVTISEFKP